MNDGIIKGNGTSRKMKATLPATYEEFKQAAGAGEQTLDVMFNASGWQQQPTFLNAGNIFSEIAAEEYAYTEDDAIPDKAFRGLVQTPGDLCRSFDINKRGPWLLCNGQLYDREKNKRLFTILSKNTQYESTFFTFPGVKAMMRAGNRFFFMSTDGKTLYYSEENVPFPNFDNAIDLTQITFNHEALRVFDFLAYANGNYIFAQRDGFSSIWLFYSQDLVSWKTSIIPSNGHFSKMTACVFFDGNYVFFTNATDGSVVLKPTLESGAGTEKKISSVSNVTAAVYDTLTDKVYVTCSQSPTALYEISKSFVATKLYSDSSTEYGTGSCLLQNETGVYMICARCNYSRNVTVTILKYGTQLLRETVTNCDGSDPLGYASTNEVFFVMGPNVYKAIDGNAAKLTGSMSIAPYGTLDNFTNEGVFVDESSKEVVVTLKPGPKYFVKTNSPRLTPVIAGDYGEYVFIRGDD